MRGQVRARKCGCGSGPHSGCGWPSAGGLTAGFHHRRAGHGLGRKGCRLRLPPSPEDNHLDPDPSWRRAHDQSTTQLEFCPPFGGCRRQRFVRDRVSCSAVVSPRARQRQHRGGRSSTHGGPAYRDGYGHRAGACSSLRLRQQGQHRGQRRARARHRGPERALQPRGHLSVENRGRRAASGPGRDGCEALQVAGSLLRRSVPAVRAGWPRRRHGSRGVGCHRPTGPRGRA